MSTLTLPAAAATFEDAPGPFYAAYPAGIFDPQPSDVLWISTTNRPPMLAWADARLAGRAATTVILLNLATIAELLAHDITTNPDHLSDAEVMAVVDAQLVAVGCDMCRCCIEVMAEQADHYDGGQRMARSLLRAGRLLGVSP